MNISTALQDKNNSIRISCGYRWLVGDGVGGWIVYEHKYHARNSTIVIETQDEEKAVSELISDDSEGDT